MAKVYSANPVAKGGVELLDPANIAFYKAAFPGDALSKLWWWPVQTSSFLKLRAEEPRPARDRYRSGFRKTPSEEIQRLAQRAGAGFRRQLALMVELRVEPQWLEAAQHLHQTGRDALRQRHRHPRMNTYDFDVRDGT